MSLKPDAAHSRGTIIFFSAVLAAALASFAWVLRDFFSDLVLGFLISGTVRPLYLRALKRLRGRRMLAAALVTLLITVAIAVPAALLITSLSRQAAAAYQIMHDALMDESGDQGLHPDGWFGARARSVFELLGLEYSAAAIRGFALDTARSIAGYLTSQLNAVVTNVIRAVYHFALLLIIVFYGLVDGPALKRRVFALSPLPDDEEEIIVRKFKDVGAAILFGSGSAAALQGTLGGLAMWVAGIPSPLFWGAVVAICAFMPVVGTSLVFVPAAGYLLFRDRWVAALSFLLFCGFQALIVDNFVTPRLVGGRMQMHNLLVFLALVGGISSFGMGGLVYGPLLAAFLLTVLDLYERVYRERMFAL